MSGGGLAGIAAAISFTLGASVGAGALYAAPHFGLRAVEQRLTKAQGAAAAQADARARESENRDDEREHADEDITAERLSCDARIADLTALWSVPARSTTQTPPNEAESYESCSCADYGDIRPLDHWLSDAGLLDDG